MLRLTAIAIAVAALSPGQRWAQATITEFTVKETPTFVNPPDRFLQSGPITHLFGQHNPNPLTDFMGSEADKMKVVGADGVGLHDSFFDAHVQFSPEGVPLHGAVAVQPGDKIVPGDGVDGHWNCAGAGTFSDGNFEATVACQGVGDLIGQKLFVRAFNDRWDGQILVPSAAGVAAVPEPATGTLAVLALLGVIGLYCTRRA